MSSADACVSCSIGGKVAQDTEPHGYEYCLSRAIECEQSAKEAGDARNKAIFLDLATRWRALAEDSKSGSSRSVGRGEQPSPE
jgi:hypothetical protein